jgi:hypothetical protein
MTKAIMKEFRKYFKGLVQELEVSILLCTVLPLPLMFSRIRLEILALQLIYGPVKLVIRISPLPRIGLRVRVLRMG